MKEERSEEEASAYRMFSERCMTFNDSLSL